MSQLNIPGLAEFKAKNPELYRALKAVQDSTNNMAMQTNADPTAATPAPQQHAGGSILGGAGVIDAKITDNSPQYRGMTHHMDVSPDASFSKFYTVTEGPSKNIRRVFPKGQYHVRTYAQYPSSPPGPALYHGVVDATGEKEPAMQEGDAQMGYGHDQFNTPTPPVR